MEIPRGTGREDIKARRQIIKDYYASWCAEHPDKKVWNNSLKAFDRMLFLYYDGIRLLAGHQKSTDEYVQYCITAKK